MRAQSPRVMSSYLSNRQMHLSASGDHRVLKVGCTIVDLEDAGVDRLGKSSHPDESAASGWLRPQ